MANRLGKPSRLDHSGEDRPGITPVFPVRRRLQHKQPTTNATVPEFTPESGGCQAPFAVFRVFLLEEHPIGATHESSVEAPGSPDVLVIGSDAVQALGDREH
jgi:hypothetical protein